MNALISGFQEPRWRKRAVALTGIGPGGSAIDVASGTGQVAGDLARLAFGTRIDFAQVFNDDFGHVYLSPVVEMPPMKVRWVRKKSRTTGRTTRVEAAMSQCQAVPPCMLWKFCNPKARVNCS